MITDKEIKKIKLWIFLAFFILSLLLFLFSGVINFNETSLGILFSGGIYVSMVLYMLLLALTASTSLPSSVVVFAGIALFPIYILVLLTIGGLFLGQSFMFFFTKKFGEEGLVSYSKMKGNRLKAFLRLLKMNTTSFVVLFAFFYFFPPNLSSVAGALGDMKFKKFISIALTGNSLNFIGFIFLSYGLYSLNWFIVIPAAVLLTAFSLVPLYIYRRNLGDILMFVFNREIKFLK
ncbi:MAG: VTT domain-containing protein [archaeon]